jgi:hypothetical protein
VVGLRPLKQMSVRVRRDLAGKLTPKKQGNLEIVSGILGTASIWKGLKKKTEPRKLIQLNNYIVLGVPFVKFG